MSRRRPTRAELAEHYYRVWLEERDSAQTQPCPACHAARGEVCRNVHTGQPLAHLPAHNDRIRAYLAQPPLPVPTGR